MTRQQVMQGSYSNNEIKFQYIPVYWGLFQDESRANFQDISDADGGMSRGRRYVARTASRRYVAQT